MGPIERDSYTFRHLSTAEYCYQNSLALTNMRQKPWSMGAPGRSRTCDPPLRRRPLYPLSYGGFPYGR